MTTSVLRALLAAALLGGCSAEGSAVDAGPPDAAVEAGVCPVDVATYCASHACPKTAAEAIAMLCAEEPEVVTCGSSVAGYAVNLGTGYDFDDAGALTTIVRGVNTNRTCVAGPRDVSVVGLCGIAGPSVCDGGSP